MINTLILTYITSADQPEKQSVALDTQSVGSLGVRLVIESYW